MKYSYLNSGVDVIGADNLVKSIKKITATSKIGDFAGIFEHPVFCDYYLVSCCDGVGTKILPLLDRGDISTIANDLFAMNINDLITTGAKPLFFLDYLAINKLNPNLLEKFIESLNDVLKKYNCTLLGGETSELGDLILKNYFDASGFLLGAVKKSDFIDKNNVKSGDVVVGLASSGAHSNGFTLLRKLYSDKVLDENLFTLALKPVQIYADIVYKLNEKKLIKSCANITGGGILSNLKRALPQGLEPCLDFNSIEKTQLFEKLKELVGVDECFKTFNMGVGFCLVVDKKDLDEVMELSSDFKPFVLGYVK